MDDTEMSLHEALNIATATLYQALDDIAAMPKEDHKYLTYKPEALIAAVRVIDTYLREQG